ncbi:MAG TPA: phosphate ABC transporter permease subunit PstC [Victivallales bacterium]|nr:phosphate ABC transporter permease subunit PstC [Victivallales bacterium]
MFKKITKSLAVLLLIVVIGIFVSLIIMSWPAIEKFGIGFIWGSSWNPVTENFGALTAILGTIITSFVAIVIAVPLSFCIAVFLTQIAPKKVSAVFSQVIELMAAVPSIIYGMWGLFVFAPIMAQYVQPFLINTFQNVPVLNFIFGGFPMGIGVFTAGVILAMMIIPLISSVIRDVVNTSPAVLKEASYSTGSTRFEYVFKVLLPYCKNGILGAVILGLGRALGETMAVTFVIGNSHGFFKGLFMPGTTISATIANEFTEALGKIYPAALIELGLVLFVITFIVLCISRYLLKKRSDA